MTRPCSCCDAGGCPECADGNHAHATDAHPACETCGSNDRVRPYGMDGTPLCWAHMLEANAKEDAYAAQQATGTRPPEVFVQWKGTDVCMDFWCSCGAQGHFDGWFAYALRCGECGRVWKVPDTLALTPAPEDQGSIQDPEMDGRE